MTENNQFHFGVDIPTKINKYSRRFTDLEGFLEEDYDGEHHMLWDSQEECWVHLDEALELMEKEYSNIEKENERIKHIIQEAYETERTAIGKNVLKQLLDNI